MNQGESVPVDVDGSAHDHEALDAIGQARIGRQGLGKVRERAGRQDREP